MCMAPVCAEGEDGERQTDAQMDNTKAMIAECDCAFLDHDEVRA